MNNILITGGAGFIGSNLVDALVKDGVEVIIIDDLSTGKIENINSSATFLKHDLSTIDNSQLITIFNKVDIRLGTVISVKKNEESKPSKICCRTAIQQL